MKQVMVDLETMSTHPYNAVILTIGMVQFELLPHGVSIIEKLEIGVEVADQLLAGRTIEEKTRRWWLDDSLILARQRILTVPTIRMQSAKTLMRDFLSGVDRIWANGIGFDITNLSSLWINDGEEPPWKYNAPREMRNVRDYPQLRERPPHVLGLTMHSCVDDAISQCWVLWERDPLLVMPPVSAAPAPAST